MTHSGGRPHAIGDRGQRYEITVFDATTEERIVLAWTDELPSDDLLRRLERRPSWSDAKVRDRQAKGDN